MSAISEPAAVTDVAATAKAVAAAVETVIDGKPEVVRLAVTVLLAEGHLLLEDVPGVGKTMLAKALARATGCTVKRVQFTPDLMPSDITGVSVYHQERHSFDFVPGPVFANVVLGDEINRGNPKTQSALLECMEEQQVTVDGTTHQLHRPFLVIATQNPVEMAGTSALPEAQRDRFMARLSMGYPSAAAERAMLEHHSMGEPLTRLDPVTDVEEVLASIEAVHQVYAADSVKQYVVSLCQATRTSSDLRLGASPRAGLHLLRAARAHAAVDGREYVLPDDVQVLAGPVLAHRVLLSTEAQASRRSADEVISGLVALLPLPGRAG